MTTKANIIISFPTLTLCLENTNHKLLIVLIGEEAHEHAVTGYRKSHYVTKIDILMTRNSHLMSLEPMYKTNDPFMTILNQ